MGFKSSTHSHTHTYTHTHNIPIHIHTYEKRHGKQTQSQNIVHKCLLTLQFRLPSLTAMAMMLLFFLLLLLLFLLLMLPLLCCCFLATIILVKAVIYVTLYILFVHDIPYLVFSPKACYTFCQYQFQWQAGKQAGGKERSGHQKKQLSRAIFIFCVGVDDDDDDDPDDNDKMLSVRCQTANLNGVIYVNARTCCMCKAEVVLAKDFR